MNNEHDLLTQTPLITSRRSLLKGLVGVGITTLIAPSILIPQFVRACEISRNLTSKGVEKTLAFYNIHTGEHLKKCVFWAEGKFIPEGQAAIKKLFRDFRTGEQKDIDANLLTLLHQLSTKLETNEPFHLISGYRSPKTNAALRKKSKGVAHKSQHPLGKAENFLNMRPSMAMGTVPRNNMSLRPSVRGGMSFLISIGRELNR